MQLKQSTARNMMVWLASSSDHLSPATGQTLTITLSKDGGAFASITPTVTELANGWYKLALTTSHTDTLGDWALHVTASGADTADILREVVSPSELLDFTAGVETGLTLRQAMRLLAAAAAGKISGAATTTVVIRNAIADSKDRITATTDSSGNRSAITVDLT